jgi:hypothetical protein
VLTAKGIEDPCQRTKGKGQRAELHCNAVNRKCVPNPLREEETDSGNSKHAAKDP